MVVSSVALALLMRAASAQAQPQPPQPRMPAITAEKMTGAQAKAAKEVQAVAAGRRPARMDEGEALVYDMCEDLRACGFYTYLGLINNATRLPPGVAPAFRPPAPR